MEKNVKIRQLIAILTLSLITDTLKCSEYAPQSSDVRVCFRVGDAFSEDPIQLSLEEAKLSGTLKDLLEQFETFVPNRPKKIKLKDSSQEEPSESNRVFLLEDSIPLPIEEEIGKYVVNLMKFIINNQEQKDLYEQLIGQIERLSLFTTDLADLFSAVNYLDIPIIYKALIGYLKHIQPFLSQNTLNILLANMLVKLEPDLIEQILFLVPLERDLEIEGSVINLSANGNTIVAVDQENHLHIFDRIGHRIGSIVNKEYSAVSVSADGNTIIARGIDDNATDIDDNIYIFSRSGNEIGTIPSGIVDYKLLVSADGNTIVAMDQENHLRIFDRTGHEVGYNARDIDVPDMSVSANGGTIVAIDREHHLYIFDRTGNEIGSDANGKYMEVSVSADGNTIVAIEDIKDPHLFYRLRIFDKVGNKLTADDDISIDWDKLFSVSADGGTIVAINQNYLRIFDRTGKNIGNNWAFMYRRGLSVSADGSAIVVIDNQHHLRIFDRTGLEIGNIANGEYCEVSISAHGNIIVAIKCDRKHLSIIGKADYLVNEIVNKLIPVDNREEVLEKVNYIFNFQDS